VLRRIIGPRKEEVAEGWRRLHDEKLNNLYASPNINRVIKSGTARWAGHVTRMGGDEKCIQNLIWKTLGYGLDERVVRLPVEAGDFSPHHRVQTSFGAYPVSYPMDIRGLFPWG